VQVSRESKERSGKKRITGEGKRNIIVVKARSRGFLWLRLLKYLTRVLVNLKLDI